jgi:hypothetical protein
MFWEAKEANKITTKINDKKEEKIKCLSAEDAKRKTEDAILQGYRDAVFEKINSSIRFGSFQCQYDCMGAGHEDKLPDEIEKQLAENGYRFTYYPSTNVFGYHIGRYMIYWD